MNPVFSFGWNLPQKFECNATIFGSSKYPRNLPFRNAKVPARLFALACSLTFPFLSHFGFLLCLADLPSATFWAWRSTTRNTMTDCNVNNNGSSGVCVGGGVGDGCITIDGSATTIHHNGTGGYGSSYGLHTQFSRDSIHLKALTKEVSLNVRPCSKKHWINLDKFVRHNTEAIQDRVD